MVETLSGDEGLPELAGWLKEKNPDAFLMVSFAVDHSGMTSAGRLGSELYRFASELAGVDAVGFNCVSGPRHLLKYIQTLELSDKPLTVMPNAGYPTVLGRRTVFGGQPDYFAGQIAQIVQAGRLHRRRLLRYYAGTSAPSFPACWKTAWNPCLPRFRLRFQSRLVVRLKAGFGKSFRRGIRCWQ